MHACGGERTTLGKLVLSFYFYVGSRNQTQVVRLEWQVLIVCVYKCACACILRPLVHARAYIQRPEDNLWESFLSWEWNSHIWLSSKHLCPPYHLITTAPYFHLIYLCVCIWVHIRHCAHMAVRRQLTRVVFRLFFSWSCIHDPFSWPILSLFCLVTGFSLLPSNQTLMESILYSIDQYNAQWKETWWWKKNWAMDTGADRKDGRMNLLRIWEHCIDDEVTSWLEEKFIFSLCFII